MFAAQRLKKGFTIMELMVVIAIIGLVTSTVGGGILYLQSSIRLDNGLRFVASHIQNTQNRARNSFVTSGSSSSNFSNRRISAGWLMTINDDGDDLRIIKRSIYFEPVEGIDLDDVKTILYDQDLVDSGDYSCRDSDNRFLENGSGADWRSGTLTMNLMCSETGTNDFITLDTSENSELTGLEVTITGSTSTVPLCYSGGNGPVNLFFISGTGHFKSLWNRAAESDCQIQLRNSEGFLSSSRAFRIRRETGTIITQNCNTVCN